MTLLSLLRPLVAALAPTLFTHLALAAPEPGTVPALALTSGRLLGATAALVSLVCLAVAIRAVRRRTSRGAPAAVSGGAVGLVLGALVVTRADQGLGSGQGLAGGVVGLVLGGLCVIVGALAWRRSWRR